MNILGVDPGQTRLGLGAIQVSKAGGVSLLSYGMIAHPRDPDVKFNAHFDEGIELCAIDFPRFINIAQPDFIVAEYVPFGKLGSNDALVISSLTCVKLIAYQFGIPFYNIAANTVKKDITGDHKATKTKIRNAMLDQFPTLAERHAKMKKEQKANGETATGLPADIFDAISTAVAGRNLHA